MLRLAWRASATSQHTGRILIVAASPTSHLVHQGLPRVPDRYHALGGQVLATVSPWITITRPHRPLATRMNARRFRPGDNPSRHYMNRGDRRIQTTDPLIQTAWWRLRQHVRRRPQDVARAYACEPTQALLPEHRPPPPRAWTPSVRARRRPR